MNFRRLAGDTDTPHVPDEAARRPPDSITSQLAGLDNYGIPEVNVFATRTAAPPSVLCPSADLNRLAFRAEGTYGIHPIPNKDRQRWGVLRRTPEVVPKASPINGCPERSSKRYDGSHQPADQTQISEGIYSTHYLACLRTG